MIHANNSQSRRNMAILAAVLVVLIVIMLVTNNPILKNGWTLVKEKLAFWRKKTPETAAEGGGVHEQ